MTRSWFMPALLAAALFTAVALVRVETPATAEEGAAPEFISQKDCKKCHFQEHKSWKKTVHAAALEALKPGERAEAKTKAGLDPAKDFTKDAACLACHVTGYGKAGGYPELKDAWSEDETKNAKDNEGVGCESCHGPGSLYSAHKKDHEDYKREDIVKMGMQAPVTADNCTGCHKAEGNPTAGEGYAFDFEEMKKKTEAIHEIQPLKHPH